MPSTNDIYGGNYISTKTLELDGGKGRNLQIVRIRREPFRNNDKLVLTLQNVKRELALNKTNAMILAKAFGDDYALWRGKTIQITTHQTTYEGQAVAGLLVKAVGEKPTAP